MIFESITPGKMQRKAGIAFPAFIKGTAENLFLEYLNPGFVPSYFEPKIRLDSIPDMPSSIDISDLFRDNKDSNFFGYFPYHSYIGSMTSPPCEESMTWYITEPIEARLSLV